MPKTRVALKTVPSLIVEFDLRDDISSKLNVWIFIRARYGKRQLHSSSRRLTAAVKKELMGIAVMLSSHCYGLNRNFWNKVTMEQMTIRVRRINGGN